MADSKPNTVRRLLRFAILVVVALLAGTGTTVSAAAFTYDAESNASVDAQVFGRAEASPTQLSDVREGSASRPFEAGGASTTPSGSVVATNTATSVASNTTRTGVVRNNPADWRRTRDVWDNAGLDDILSDANRKAIAGGRSPVVDDAWVRHFPGDEALMGERISPHHLGGGPITAPLPASRHLDAHMPGGFRYNPGGPGATG